MHIQQDINAKIEIFLKNRAFNEFLLNIRNDNQANKTNEVTSTDENNFFNL